MMAAGTFSSRLLGLVREILFAAYFDRQVTDAFMAAFRIPNLFRRLLGEGSLSVSFQPILIEAQAEDLKTGGSRSRDLINSMHVFLLGLLGILTVAGVIFSEPLLHLILDSQYTQNAEAFYLTHRLAQIMFGFLFFICLFAYYMAILNANGIFAWPALAPVFFNVAMIASTLFPQNLLPTRADALGWGVVVGGFLQMAVLIPPLYKHGLFPRLRGDFLNSDLLRVLRNTLPGMAGLGLMQVTLFVNTHFASSLGEGAMSYVNWADRLLELPLSLVSVSLGTALLPALSEYWVQGQRSKMMELCERTLSLNLFLGAMAAGGLYFLADPIVRLLFQRGLFQDADAVAVVGVLQVYAFTLLPVSAVRVLAPAYFAAKNTWLPAVVSGVCLAIHIILAPQLIERYQLQGLNLSSLASGLLNFVLLFAGLRYLAGEFPMMSFLKKTFKSGLALGGMGLLMFFMNSSFFTESSGFGERLLQVLIVGGSGVGAFLLLSWAIRHEESHAFWNLLKRKWKRV